MKHPTLEQLNADTTYRASLVETMRGSAMRLMNRDPEVTLECDPALAQRVAYTYAQQLLEAASGLCDHCRIESDGRCRYCNAIVVSEGE